jgi:hypothetical protein
VAVAGSDRLITLIARLITPMRVPQFDEAQACFEYDMSRNNGCIAAVAKLIARLKA